MVRIRLARRGAKKKPFYHIVVADKRDKLRGRVIERLGFFNPYARGGEPRMQCNTTRFDYWLGQGAQASDRIATLLKEYRKMASA